ncbi:PorP/SprF family type IX secretion system membrane protein [Saonia flava]|uniref:PorP/SprF family type IX secretion system membrane protein n=1 Tax=Saonia flava TaxID=523696 RepID=UPI00143A94DF|nr:PorP/SprF family type IX secretion system membrane protein [Saonia flava]
MSTLLFINIIISSYSQGIELPIDYRQHNLTEYNSSLFNPTFSLNGSNAHSIALWSRWQWQTIDGDPTSIFVGYNGRLSHNTNVGAGFIQHNTGTFLQTGGVMNFAYDISLGGNTSVSIGANIFGFQQKLANDIFQPDPNIQLPQLAQANSFIMQVAPGIRLNVDGFTVGFASENLISLSSEESNTSEKVYMAHTSYNFPLEVFRDTTSYIAPLIYLKSIHGYDTQFGFNTLFSTSKFWAQTGYNSFYGFSIGGGAKLFKLFSLGALVEFGTDSSIGDKDPSFEIVSAFSFGKSISSKKVVDFELEDKEDVSNEKEILEQEKYLKDQQRQDSITKVKEVGARIAQQKELEQKRKDSINTIKLGEAEVAKQKTEMDRIAMLREQELRKQDSLNSIKQAQLDKVAQQKVLNEKQNDSIAAARLSQTEVVKANDTATFEENKAKTKAHYEEAVSENNQLPGYYLIANVYRTKVYFEKFIKTLEGKGLQPKSFYRTVSKYNYVYLERYDSIEEAEKARLSKYNGKYPDSTWIFRIK